MLKFKIVERGLLVGTFAAIVSSGANAACTLHGTNGEWDAVFTDTITGIPMVCDFTFKGTRLLSDSRCTDEEGDIHPLTNSRVQINKEDCSTQVEYRMLGDEYMIAFTYDRAVTVATGLFFSEDAFRAGTVNMVKKGSR